MRVVQVRMGSVSFLGFSPHAWLELSFDRLGYLFPFLSVRHFPPSLSISLEMSVVNSYYPGEPFFQALARHEHFLSAHLNLKPGMRVLDVGCGVGGPAREIARFSDAHIVGLNNNQYQVERARKYTEKAGLSDRVEFVKGDFMKYSLSPLSQLSLY